MRMPALIACALASGAALAQELSLAGGETRTRVPEAHSFGVGITYTHGLAANLEASLAYRNEGHVPGHHRDGHAAQLWLKAPVAVPELTLAVGAGPYYYFDTALAEGSDPSQYDNAHGWGALYGVTATWRPRTGKWFYQVRVEHAEARRSLDTTMILATVGYRLEQDPAFPPAGEAHALRGGELFAGLGQTIVNSLQSESNHAVAGMVSYRHAFGPVLRASVGWIHESDARLVRRNGVALQGWLEPSFDGGRFTLGLGGGGYLAVDHYRPGEKDLMGLIGTTASYRVADHWSARLEWQRVASTHDRDSDIVLLGMAYRF